MKLSQKLLLSIAFVWAATALHVPAQEIRLNLTRPDEYASRRMVIFKKSGEQVSNLIKIHSYDPGNGQFVMEGLTGETVTVPVSDIKEIVFEQGAERQSPMAQTAAWEIRQTLGPAMRYKVAQRSLRVKSGDLVLPASSPATPLPVPTVPALPAVSGATATSATVTEPRKLTYDRAGKSFLVEVQTVTYTKEMFGSGGASGVRK